MLTALEDALHSRDRINFLCECGIVRAINPVHVKSKNTKSCGCLRKRRGPEASFWKGGRHISSRYFKHIKGHAVRGDRNLDWDLTIDYLDDLWESQEGRCAYTGIPLKLDHQVSDRTDQTASLDRINNDLGYVKGNVQFLHKIVNEMKWDLEEEVFISFCIAVANKAGIIPAAEQKLQLEKG